MSYLKKIAQLVSRISLSKEFKFFIRMMVLSVMTLWSTLVSFSTGIIVMFSLKEMGTNNTLVLTFGILIASVTFIFIWFFSKIKNFILGK
jgi:hypothetical protein